MLRAIRSPSGARRGGAFAIVASRYNAPYVDAMLRAARAELRRARARVRIVRVPGAYEIPVVAQTLAQQAAGPARTEAGRPARGALDAILCLGVILRGETVHAAHIGEAVSRALMEIQLAHGIPVIHEVLLLENQQQAHRRCLDPRHNRGREAAQTALEMAAVMRRVRRARAKARVANSWAAAADRRRRGGTTPPPGPAANPGARQRPVPR